MAPMPFLARLWFSISCFFRVLSDGRFAASVKAFTAGPVPAPELAAPAAPVAVAAAPL